jgi:hypothetical protein
LILFDVLVEGHLLGVISPGEDDVDKGARRVVRSERPSEGKRLSFEEGARNVVVQNQVVDRGRPEIPLSYQRQLVFSRVCCGNYH